MNRKKRLVIILGGVGVAWAGAALWLLLSAWGRLPLVSPDEDADWPVMTSEAYRAVIDTHARPYVYDLALPGRAGAAVLVFGTEHSKDPASPQLVRLEEEFRRFGPTVVLVESRLGVLFPAFHNPVKMFGEMGRVAALAKSQGVPVRSWEPPPERIVADLEAQGFTREQIGLRFILGPAFSNRRFGAHQNPEGLIRDSLTRKAREAGARDLFPSFVAVQASWDRAFPGGPDWRDVSDEYGLPGFLGGMDINAARDRHLLRVIAHLTRAGERVMVVAGSSHAVKIEAGVRAIAAQTPAAGSATPGP